MVFAFQLFENGNEIWPILLQFFDSLVVIALRWYSFLRFFFLVLISPSRRYEQLTTATFC